VTTLYGGDPITSEQLDTRAKGLALALLAMTQFVIILDASIVNVALPSIGAALDFSQDNLSWVVNAYTLTFGGFLLLGGRLADLLGRRRMFMSGLVLFTAASLLGGLAQSDVWLIAARAAQGLGAALVSPAALSLVTTIFSEGAERNRALGVWGAVAGSGGAAGVLLGGMLTEWAGWEWVLFVNVPIGLAAVALAPRLLPESRYEGAARTFDATGAVLVTGGLALLVYTLVDAESAGWTSTQTLGLGALSLATLAAFVAWEARASDPLMPFSIFRLRTLRGANAVGLLLGMALFSMFFFLSLYLQQVLGYSALETGFAFLPLAVMIIVSSTVASQLVTRTGARPTLVVGMLLITGALIWFSQVSAGGSYVSDVLFPALVVAVGLGFAFVPVTIAAVTGTRPNEAGLASGLINTSQQIGGALGLAILVSVATSRTASAVADGIGDQAVALNEGFQTAFLVGAGFALVGAIVATLTISSRDCRQQLEAGRVDVPVPCVGQPQVQPEVATAPAGAQATAATTSNLGDVDRGQH
jgi:EmrB/QacA subfamily drug resistance transporter